MTLLGGSDIRLFGFALRGGFGFGGQNAEAPGDFAVGVLNIAEIQAETVFIHFLAGFHVPQAAIIGADFVGQDDALHTVFEAAAEFQFEIHQADTKAGEQPAQEIIGAQRHEADVVDVLRGGPLEGEDVFFADQRVAQLVVFQEIFHQGLAERGALFHAVALGEAAGGVVPDDDFERDDLHGFHQLFAHVERADEMRGYADFGQPQHQAFGDAVVEHALAADGAAFLVIERGCVILEVLDQRAGLGAFEQLLGLAFVDGFAGGHEWINIRLEHS